MRLEIRPKAREDLESIQAWSRAHFGPQQAKRYGAELKARIAAILAHPLMHRERFEFDPPLRVCRHKAHVILYRVTDAEIVILRVRHGREDWVSGD